MEVVFMNEGRNINIPKEDPIHLVSLSLSCNGRSYVTKKYIIDLFMKSP